ncbi:MAG: WGR domain-containing protein [Isosphaeraceae bacterium]
MSRREFHLVEGKSSKFWAIELDGSSHTVHFGRIGTAGQTSRKEFGNEAAARTSYDKLVAEKVNKGYTEVAGETNAASAATAMLRAPARPKPPAKAEPEPEAGAVAAPEPAASAYHEPEAAPAPAPAVPIGPAERRIQLDPEDAFWALWRDPEPLPRPVPPAFDRAATLQRLGKVKAGEHYWTFDWNKLGIPPAMSREEALFWVELLELTMKSVKPKELVSTLAAKQPKPGRTLSLAQFVETTRHHGRNIPVETVAPMTTLFTFGEIVALICEPSSQSDWLEGVRLPRPERPAQVRAALHDARGAGRGTRADPQEARPARPAAGLLHALPHLLVPRRDVRPGR